MKGVFPLHFEENSTILTDIITSDITINFSIFSTIAVKSRSEHKQTNKNPITTELNNKPL
jgi:hypothetical protein